MGPHQVQEEVIRKIKKYKISVRPFGVLRHLKRKASIAEGQEPGDEILESEISKVQPHVVPCALYATFSRAETPEPLRGLWQSSPEKSLSMSMVLATIGKAIEGEIEKAPQSGDAGRNALLDSIARESLDQSFHFVARLLNDEAQEESCELTPFLPVAGEAIKDVFHILEADKAGIHLNDSGQISPFFTGARFSFWTPKGKGSRSK